jgi:hypothetical protein
LVPCSSLGRLKLMVGDVLIDRLTGMVIGQEHLLLLNVFTHLNRKHHILRSQKPVVAF